MISALALILIAQTGGEPCYRVPRAGHGCGMRVGGRSGANYAFFEAFTASGAGLTSSACSTTAPTGAKGEVLSFSRATVAECYSNDGQTLTQMAVNQPMVSSGRIDSTVMGIWREGARTMLMLHNRDWSNAAYAKTDMTCAKTATGMRADANGASTCTATGANGTALQSIVVASAARASSGHIKRRTGTGTIEVTRDNGTTWTDITARVSSSLWRRVVPQATAGCSGGNCIVVPAMTATAANPVIGIRLGTSGDAVDLDFWQDEDGIDATSPRETAGVSVTRAADVATFPATTAVGSLSIRFTGAPANAGSGGYLLMLWKDANKFVSLGYAAANCQWWDNPTNPNTANDFASPGNGSIFYACQRPSLTGTTTCLQGACNTGVTASLALTSAAYVVNPGANQSGAAHINGVYSELCVDPVSGRCPNNDSTNNDSVAWLGDSIVAGTGSNPSNPPKLLRDTLDGAVINFGTGGYTAAQCATRWTDKLSGAGHRTLIWSCGVNSLFAGISGAVTWATAQAALEAAQAQGVHVIVTSVTPWKDSSGWTAGKQVETLAYNAAAAAWAATNEADYVDTYTPLDNGGDPGHIAAAYDSGDAIHPNAAGAAVMVAPVRALNP